MIDFLESNWRKMFSCENGNSQLLFFNPCLQPAWTSFERVTNMINLKMKCNFLQSKNSFMLCQSDTLIFSRIYCDIFVATGQLWEFEKFNEIVSWFEDCCYEYSELFRSSSKENKSKSNNHCYRRESQSILAKNCLIFSALNLNFISC